MVSLGGVQQGAEVGSTAQLVALWLHGKSGETQRSYEGDLRCFIGFLLGRGSVQLNDLDLRGVTLNDVQGFDDFLEGQGLAAASRRRKLAALRSLLRFAHELGYLNFNVGLKLKLPQPKQVTAQRILSELQVMTMIALAGQGRERCLIQLLYYTGARVGEVAKLRWQDVQPNREGQGQVTLFGKGDQTRTVIIPASLYGEMLALRSGDDPEGAVLASRKGKQPLQQRQIREIVAAVGKKAGIGGKVSPHWLRHAHASHALDRGASPQLVQQTLGHKSLETTTRYAHARPSDSSGLYLPS